MYLGVLDDDLCRPLGEEAARLLALWALNKGTRYKLQSWFDGGKSGALVCAVEETGPGNVVRRLILKVDAVHDAIAEPGEYRRHSDAASKSKDFAAAHLTGLVYDPIPAGHSKMALFQEIVGDDVGELVVVSAVLEAARAGGGEAQAEAFTAVCENVVRSVLADWAEKPRVLSREAHEHWQADKDGRVSVASFLRVSLENSPRTGRLIMERAKGLSDPYIAVSGEARRLPSPFATLNSETPIAMSRLSPLMGKAHGDLHAGNILLPIDTSRPGAPDPAGFRLVDLAKYKDELPLTGDPVHLVLYVIARVMGDLSDSQRDALIDLLTRHASGHVLPAWLVSFIGRVAAVGRDWAAASKVAASWQRQVLLSIVVNGLIFWARDSTEAAHRDWFLRLAGRALEEYERFGHDRSVVRPAWPHRPAADQVRQGERDPLAWISEFCRLLPELRRRAAGTPLATEVESLVTAAQTRTGAEDRFAEVVRRLDDLHGEGMRNIPGLSGGWPLMDDVYACPTGACHRQDMRDDVHGIPVCHVPHERRMKLRRL